jgi:hypothetical protein
MMETNRVKQKRLLRRVSARTLHGATLVNTIPADSTVLRCFAIMSRLGVSGLGGAPPGARG